jgi:hypothetical protein
VPIVLVSWEGRGFGENSRIGYILGQGMYRFEEPRF